MYDHRGIREEIVCRYLPQVLWNRVYFAYRTNYVNYNNIQTQSLVDDENSFLDFLLREEDIFLGYSGYHGDAYSPFNKTLRGQLKEEYLKRKTKMGKDKNSEFRELQIKIKKLKESIKLRNALSLRELTLIIGREKFAEIAQGILRRWRVMTSSLSSSSMLCVPICAMVA